MRRKTIPLLVVSDSPVDLAESAQHSVAPQVPSVVPLADFSAELVTLPVQLPHKPVHSSVKAPQLLVKQQVNSQELQAVLSIPEFKPELV